MSESAEKNAEKDRQRVDVYRKELAQDPSSLAFIPLAETLNRLAEWDEAARVARRGLEAHPDSVTGLLTLAVAEAGRDNIKDALELIKNALIIDQENPRALALMGSLLLQKGLAKRAVQFLNQAVKLDPESREYIDLLKRAKRLAKLDNPVQLPVVRGENVPAVESPWNEADEGAEPTVFAADAGSEHTVFAPDGGRKLGAAKPAPSKPSAPSPFSHFDEDEEEVTRHHSDGPPGRRVPTRALPASPHEEGTAFDLRKLAPPSMAAAAPLPSGKKPKLGGSAADYSRILRQADIPAEGPTVDGVPAPQARGRPSAPPPVPDATGSAPAVPAPSPPPTPPADEAPTRKPRKEPKEPTPSEGRAPVATAGPAPASAVAPPASAPSEAPAAPSRVSAAPPADAPPAAAVAAPAEAAAVPAEPAPSERPRKKGKAAAAAEAAEAAAAPSAPSADRPATMMVDDAIWAIYGGEKPGADKGGVRVKDEAAPEAKAPKAAAEAAQPARPGVMVVQTSRWLGTLTYLAVVVVLAGAAGAVGYALASSSTGRSTSESTEELRGIVSDLERGGLAALLSAQEATEAALTATPQLAPVLRAAEAEIEARLWADFGGAPAARQAALSALAALGEAEPTLEVLVARTALSTGTGSLASLDRALGPVLEAYPDSPKAWVLRARIARRQGRATDALRALAQARALHPTRRETTLELARWHVWQRGASAAMPLYSALLERQPSDVEALLERYVVHQVTGADPDAGQTASALAGLVREESPDVAKDETGRVSLAFAVHALGSGDVEASLGFLGPAESAFQDSAAFKGAVGSVLLVLGEWDRAQAQLDRAVELAPEVAEYRVRRSLVELGKSAGLTRPELRADARGAAQGRVRAPLGTIRFVLERFELVEVEPDADVLPVRAYRSASSPRAIAGAQAVALARLDRSAGRLPRAIERLEEARRTSDTPEVLTELGRAYVARGDTREALAVLRAAVDGAGSRTPAAVAARLELAELLSAEDEVVKALDVLEPLLGRDVVAPRAALLAGELRLLRGDEKGALAAVEAAKAIDPESARVERTLGKIRHAQGDEELALQHFERALQLHKGLGEPAKGRDVEGRTPLELYYLGRALSDKNDKGDKRAVQLLEDALARDGAPPEAHYYLGKLLVKKPKTKKQGVRELQKYRALRPDGPRADEAARLAKGR